MNNAHVTDSENLSIVKSAIDAYNAHDVNRALEHEGESIVQYSPNSLVAEVGRDLSRQSKVNDFTAFPDIQLKADRILSEGDWVSVQGNLNGTNTGSITAGPSRAKKTRMVKATGRRISIPVAYFLRLHDGKIVEVHAYWDSHQVVAQLGLLRKNVGKVMSLIIIGLGLMVAQATILARPETWLQLLLTAALSLWVILSASWLGRTLLAFSKIH